MRACSRATRKRAAVTDSACRARVAQLEKVSKATLAARLEADHDLARDFYKHMAIAVTQRLSLVSSASAEIPEAPRGAAQPIDGKASKELSAAKLLKVRRRLNIPDAVAMACMMKTSMVSGKKCALGATIMRMHTCTHTQPRTSLPCAPQAMRCVTPCMCVRSRTRMRAPPRRRTITS